MSPSARRLSATVATNRFSWQGDRESVAGASSVVPMLRNVTGSGASSVTPALRDLPSPTADRMDLLERDAYARGHADGQRDGEAAAVVRLEANTTRLGAAVAELAAVRGVLMRRAERDLVRLAVSMAERVLRREVDIDRELLVVMARVAIDRLGEQAAATIHLNPVDLESVTARHAAELGKSVELVADPSVPRGGCVVRSAFGTIDTGIDSQVRELSRALLGADVDEEREGLDGTPAA
jgi:flagellar assembly protein FliH